ncbi:MAG: NAD(P)-dependent oxidoreductase, partial [Rhodobacterales bacterium]|nr:NAD(P)-dependent oxidoreductase [Rhodobacterales bacterium]
MTVAVTGGTGLVGRHFVRAARAVGQGVVILSRRPPPPGTLAAGVDWQPFDLAAPRLPAGVTTLVHCALAHEPGRYRGGEGGEPERFVRLNRDGSIALFAAARAAGVARAVFLSSRAVYDGLPPGAALDEGAALAPDTLYGRVKAQVERALDALTAPGFQTLSLRATGVYGPGPDHKWAGLFAEFAAGRPIAPRAGTEVHGDDLARAADLALAAGVTGPLNVTDLVVDRHDLLA